MTAETVVSQGLRMASAPLDDVPHRRRHASYPEALRNDPKHDVFLFQDTGEAVYCFCVAVPPSSARLAARWISRSRPPTRSRATAQARA
jgi:hypothetical protein